MYGFPNKEKISEADDRIDVSHYVWAFLRELSELEGKKVKVRTLYDATRIQALLNLAKNTQFKSLCDLRGNPYWYEQKVTFVPSNIGKGRGFIFYFICNWCERRVKYLYRESLCDEPRCRICCHLFYEQPNRKARTLSRLIRRPYISSEAKYMIIKTAGITEKDLEGI